MPASDITSYIVTGAMVPIQMVHKERRELKDLLESEGNKDHLEDRYGVTTS